MRKETAVSERHELYIPDLDNHIVIENTEGGVVISVSRDNVSDKRRTFFIRQLAAEGYIPDRYEWFSHPGEDGFSGVTWIAPAASNEQEIGLRRLRKLCTRRNAVYGSLFIVWLLFFIWVVRHARHGLGV